MSLRKAAKTIGISHVYLAEVERGVRAPLRRERWKKLMDAVPNLTEQELERAAAVDRPIEISLRRAPRNLQEVTLAFARRVEDLDLDDEVIAKMLKLLSKPGGEES